MKLSSDECQRFYQIWWSLLGYVNRQKNLVPNFSITHQDGEVDPRDAWKIRNVLWESPDDLLCYIANNPDGLSDRDLALVASWRKRVSGDFYVMRHLKKHTIFLLTSKKPVAYGVLGLASTLDEAVQAPLPVLIKAVLLPYEGQIIYDGLFMSYPVTFGRGIRNSLTQSLKQATEVSGIITSLNRDDNSGASEAIVEGNKKIMVEFSKSLTKAGLSTPLVLRHVSIAEDFVTNHLQTASPPRSLRQLDEEDLHRYFAQPGSSSHRVSIKRLVKFLLDSERIDWDTAQSMAGWLIK